MLLACFVQESRFSYERFRLLRLTRINCDAPLLLHVLLSDQSPLPRSVKQRKELPVQGRKSRVSDKWVVCTARISCCPACKSTLDEIVHLHPKVRVHVHVLQLSVGKFNCLCDRFLISLSNGWKRNIIPQLALNCEMNWQISVKKPVVYVSLLMCHLAAACFSKYISKK